MSKAEGLAVEETHSLLLDALVTTKDRGIAQADLLLPSMEKMGKEVVFQAYDHPSPSYSPVGQINAYLIAGIGVKIPELLKRPDLALHWNEASIKLEITSIVLAHLTNVRCQMLKMSQMAEDKRTAHAENAKASRLFHSLSFQTLTTPLRSEWN
jgi:hypothetical protein